VKTAKATIAFRDSAETNRRPHQRSCAGRGDYSCEHACEKGACVTTFAGETVAGACEGQAKVEHAGKRECHEEQKKGHRDHEARGLQLEPPPRLFAHGPQREQ
jgi:hypothetical protein